MASALHSLPPRVVVVGGGVAALEATLALRHHAGDEIAIDLLTPERELHYRPFDVAGAFGPTEPWRLSLDQFAQDTGARLVHASLERVDGAGRRARLHHGGTLPYDALLLAHGARRLEWLPGAITYPAGAGLGAFQGLLRGLTDGYVERVAFVVPDHGYWPLAVYEMAFATARHARASGVSAELVLVTPEERPLHVFGAAASAAVGEELERAGIALRTGARVGAWAEGRLRLVPEGELSVQRVVTMPQLEGVRMAGVPANHEGFVPVDHFGRVRGLERVYAAGDTTTHPYKQGGLACQQADAAARSLLVDLGFQLVAVPYRPVLRAAIVTAGDPLYLSSPLTGPGRVTRRPWASWTPLAKVAGKHLVPYLEQNAPPASPQAGRALATS